MRRTYVIAKLASAITDYHMLVYYFTIHKRQVRNNLVEGIRQPQLRLAASLVQLSVWRAVAFPAAIIEDGDAHKSDEAVKWRMLRQSYAGQLRQRCITTNRFLTAYLTLLGT